MSQEQEFEHLFIQYQKYNQEKYENKDWQKVNKLITNLTLDKTALSKLLKKHKNKYKVKLYKNKESSNYTHMFIGKEFFRISITDIFGDDFEINHKQRKMIDKLSDKYGGILSLLAAIGVPLGSIYIIKDILPLNDPVVTVQSLVFDTALALIGIIDFKFSGKSIERSQGLDEVLFLTKDMLEIHQEKIDEKLSLALEEKARLSAKLKEKSQKNSSENQKQEKQLLEKIKVVTDIDNMKTLDDIMMEYMDSNYQTENNEAKTKKIKNT